MRDDKVFIRKWMLTYGLLVCIHLFKKKIVIIHIMIILSMLFLLLVNRDILQPDTDRFNQNFLQEESNSVKPLLPSVLLLQ